MSAPSPRRATGDRGAVLVEFALVFPMLAMLLFALLSAAGPRTMTKSEGKMQNTIGISIFTGAFIALSWAAWRREMRMSSA